MKPETEEWMARSEEHLSAASVLLEQGLHRHCIFFCQQSLEMLLKAIWVEQASEGLPRRTHDLVALSKELALEVSEEWLEFLRKLSEQYIPTRYGDVQVEYSGETAQNYEKGTKEISAWLRQRLS